MIWLFLGRFCWLSFWSFWELCSIVLFRLLVFFRFGLVRLFGVSELLLLRLFCVCWRFLVLMIGFGLIFRLIMILKSSAICMLLSFWMSLYWLWAELELLVIGFIVVNMWSDVEVDLWEVIWFVGVLICELNIVVELFGLIMVKLIIKWEELCWCGGLG